MQYINILYILENNIYIRLARKKFILIFNIILSILFILLISFIIKTNIYGFNAFNAILIFLIYTLFFKSIYKIINLNIFEKRVTLLILSNKSILSFVFNLEYILILIYTTIFFGICFYIANIKLTYLVCVCLLFLLTTLFIINILLNLVNNFQEYNLFFSFIFSFPTYMYISVDYNISLYIFCVFFYIIFILIYIFNIEYIKNIIKINLE